jgi:serine/threonine protein kinase
MSNKQIIGLGGSAIVSAYDETTVLKGYLVVLDGQVTDLFSNVERSKRALAVEYQVYERLGQHSNILKCFGWVEVQPNAFSLRLELALKGNLRSFIETTDSSQVAVSFRLTWARDLAAGLAHIHSRRVFHCDFSCRNALLTEKSVVKICDFGGARLDENESDGVEEPRYELPLRGREWEARPYIKRDLFALGSSIYELMAWKKPFAELSDGEVEKRFDREEFPDVSNVLCTDIVRKCWNEEYERAEDVMLDLQAAMSTQKD